MLTLFRCYAAIATFSLQEVYASYAVDMPMSLRADSLCYLCHDDAADAALLLSADDITIYFVDAYFHFTLSSSFYISDDMPPLRHRCRAAY